MEGTRRVDSIERVTVKGGSKVEEHWKCLVVSKNYKISGQEVVGGTIYCTFPEIFQTNRHLHEEP